MPTDLSAASPDPASDPEIAARQRWMGVLARADAAHLGAAWDTLEDLPSWTRLRGPETGMVMVRGRVGGDGGAFNLGEMTVTRCSVRLGAWVGHAWVAGRSAARAEMAAVLDALLQDPERRQLLEARVVAPLEAGLAASRAAAAARAGATRVDFFTMLRGED